MTNETKYEVCRSRDLESLKQVVDTMIDCGWEVAPGFNAVFLGPGDWRYFQPMVRRWSPLMGPDCND